MTWNMHVTYGGRGQASIEQALARAGRVDRIFDSNGIHVKFNTRFKTILFDRNLIAIVHFKLNLFTV